MSIDKQFHGDLEAVSKGQMLATRTGQLLGLAGRMTIRITDGKHFNDLEYTLPE